MRYIILDLEWDSAYSVKYKRFLNQILQIGAVKLDESFTVVDTFEVTVKSSFSKKVTGRFTALTGITKDDMLAGISFSDAVDRYNNWAGTDTITMTWSNSDLFTILENRKFLLNDLKSLNIEKYVDLQKFIQGEMRISGIEITNQLALGKAAEMLGISTENFDLHTAKDDSLACATMLKKCYNEKRFNEMIKDTQNPEFYKRLLFKPYAISDISDKNIEKKQLEFKCEKCGGATRRFSDWKYRNRWFTANFKCKNCDNKFNGRVCFKKTYDEIIIRHKICDIKVKSEISSNAVQSVSENV